VLSGVLGVSECKNAVLHASFDFLCLGPTRKRKGTSELAIAPLANVVPSVITAGLGSRLGLATDGKAIVMHVDVDVFFLQTWELDGSHKLIVGNFFDVHPWSPGPRDSTGVLSAPTSVSRGVASIVPVTEDVIKLVERIIEEPGERHWDRVGFWLLKIGKD